MMRRVNETEATEYLDRLREKIIQAQTEQGLSIRTVAALAGVNRRTVERFRAGRFEKTSMRSVYAICAALGVDFETTARRDEDANS